jgi:hypothetical protein
MRYTTKNKKVKIDGEEYEAHMVSDHGALDGIILHTIDENYDEYSRVTCWKTTIYILKKGSKKWELFYRGARHDCPITCDGYFNTLAALESKENLTKKRINDCKASIKHYQDEIKRLKGFIRNELSILKKIGG